MLCVSFFHVLLLCVRGSSKVRLSEHCVFYYACDNKLLESWNLKEKRSRRPKLQTLGFKQVITCLTRSTCQTLYFCYIPISDITAVKGKTPTVSKSVIWLKWFMNGPAVVYPNPDTIMNPNYIQFMWETRPPFFIQHCTCSCCFSLNLEVATRRKACYWNVRLHVNLDSSLRDI